MASAPAPRPDPQPGVSQPHLNQESREIQRFDQLRQMPLGLPDDVCSEMAAELNMIQCDTRILHDLYKKTHWLVRGATFYQLHLLMEKHAEEQEKLVDTLAERVQALGGVAVGDPRHVAELTRIPRPPDGVEEVPAMLSRLIDAHQTIIRETRKAARRSEELEDLVSNDILVSDVLRTNELQIWFIAEHLVDRPLVIVPEGKSGGGPTKMH